MLEEAQSKLKVLDVDPKPKRLSELKAEVEKARAEELSKQMAWELAKREGETGRRHAPSSSIRPSPRPTSPRCSPRPHHSRRKSCSC